ncbi:MAG: proton-conducting transporter membrane subunit, partial [Terrimicrobiaceae bacterium]|nr:proton-conducting transporter membrane subunit [Terrimicrobiaceae bacterium]
GGGGLAMLAGLILLGQAAGTFEISELLGQGEEVAGLPGFGLILGLLLAGAFTKSAQFPFHFWLPNAMEAPAPVSAFLHSATMVKAGVFLLARLHSCLSPSPMWEAVVAPVGAATMVVGVWLALGQRDLKKILAYTTVAVLGVLTLLLGLGTPLAVKAAMTFLLAHALYKAALFMTSGTVDHETGTRDPEELGGLRRAMPWTATAALLGALSMAGLPFLLGFVSKEYFYKALLDAPGWPGVWEALGVLSSAVMVALAGVAGIKPFWGSRLPTPKPAHEGPWTMWLGPLLLGVGALKFGVFPGLAGELLVGPAAAAVLGEPGFVAGLKLWHGFTTALGLSALTFALGVGIYFVAAPRLRQARGLYEGLAKFGPERVYFATLHGMLDGAGHLTRLVQNGYLRNYLLTVGAFTVLLAGVWVAPNIPAPDWAAMAPLTPLGLSLI